MSKCNCYGCTTMRHPCEHDVMDYWYSYSKTDEYKIEHSVVRGNERDYKVVNVQGNPWDCNVSIPDDTPSEMNAWLKSIGN